MRGCRRKLDSRVSRERQRPTASAGSAAANPARKISNASARSASLVGFSAKFDMVIDVEGAQGRAAKARPTAKATP